MNPPRRPDDDSSPELEFDDRPTHIDPPPRTRTPTPARPLETLAGYEPGREVGRREGIILACETFLLEWMTNPKNDVGMAFLLAQRVAKACGVELPRRIPGARAPGRAAALPPPSVGRRGR